MGAGPAGCTASAHSGAPRTTAPGPRFQQAHPAPQAQPPDHRVPTVPRMRNVIPRPLQLGLTRLIHQPPKDAKLVGEKAASKRRQKPRGNPRTQGQRRQENLPGQTPPFPPILLCSHPRRTFVTINHRVTAAERAVRPHPAVRKALVKENVPSRPGSAPCLCHRPLPTPRPPRNPLPSPQPMPTLTPWRANMSCTGTSRRPPCASTTPRS